MKKKTQVNSEEPIRSQRVEKVYEARDHIPQLNGMADIKLSIHFYGPSYRA